jgi:hypothetical protein
MNFASVFLLVACPGYLYTQTDPSGSSNQPSELHGHCLQAYFLNVASWQTIINSVSPAIYDILFLPSFCFWSVSSSVQMQFSLLQYTDTLPPPATLTIHNAMVLLHNGGSCYACTIKRSISLLCIPKQST